ncbi:hypothetical protein [Psychroserpens sp.]|jgi:hypothetical protein
MKKLLLSLVALMFATLLFSQDDSSDVKDELTQENIVKVQSKFQA